MEDGVATRKEAAPQRLQGIDIIEHLETQLPLNLEFSGPGGASVRLQDVVSGERPVLFTLNYAECPMLCSLQLAGLVDTLRKMDLVLGADYDVVTVSLDPNEKPQRTAEVRQRYLQELGEGVDGSAWQFLRGSPASIEALASALGIQYGFNEKRQDYLHPAVVVVTTPSGKIARYLYGIEYHPRTLRLSLVEAAEGKVGSSVDRLILYCFHYDETEGRYAPVAMNVMRAGGGLTALGLGGFLGAYWWRQLRRRTRRQAPATA